MFDHVRHKVAQVCCGILLRSLMSQFELRYGKHMASCDVRSRRRLEPAGHAFHAVHEKPNIKAPPAAFFFFFALKTFQYFSVEVSKFCLQCPESVPSRLRSIMATGRRPCFFCKALHALRRSMLLSSFKDAASDDDSPPDSWRSALFEVCSFRDSRRSQPLTGRRKRKPVDGQVR